MVDLQWNKSFALEQTGGDEELLEELLVLFRDSSQNDFVELQHAVKNGDAAAVVRAAHSLKGAAASLGIEGIRQLAAAMEADGRNESLAVAQDNVAAMGALLTQLGQLL